MSSYAGQVNGASLLHEPLGEGGGGRNHYTVDLSGYVTFKAAHDLLLGLALGATTRNIAAGALVDPHAHDADQVQSAVGVAVSYIRLRRCLTTLPEDASTGETPHRLANEASLLNLWGLSLRPRSRASQRRRYRCPVKRPTPGRLAPPAGRGARLARRSLPRGPRNGGPPNGARTWSPTVRREGHLGGGSVRPPRRDPSSSSRVRAEGRGVPQVPSGASPGAGWRPLGPRLHRGATGRPQDPDHLHAAVSTLGSARRFSGQH